MNQVLKIACVIPARLGSTRFPRKVLAPLLGKPLIQWVYEAARQVSLFDQVVIAADAEEIRFTAEKFGACVLMTSPHCTSGTDRLVELVEKKLLEADIFVNWQGDEPLISSEMIDQLLQTIHRDRCQIWTLCKEVKEADSPHVVKVALTHLGEALYFSRSPIPYFRDSMEKRFLKHIGLYAYTKEALQRIASLPPSILEEAEKLEQLRYLEGGLKIKVHKTTEDIFGVDTPQQLYEMEQFLQAQIRFSR